MIKIFLTKEDYKIIETGRKRFQNGDINHDYNSTDFPLGKVGEKIIIQKLIQEGYDVVRISKKEHSDLELYDIIFIKDGVYHTEEVKFDFFTAKGYTKNHDTLGVVRISTSDSGNLFAEDSKNYFKKNKKGQLINENGELLGKDERAVVDKTVDSGYNITRADLYSTVMWGAVDEIWSIHPEKLKLLIDILKERKETIHKKEVGDRRANGWLVNRESNREHFNVTKFEIQIVDDYPEGLKEVYTKHGY